MLFERIKPEAVPASGPAQPLGWPRSVAAGPVGGLLTLTPAQIRQKVLQLLLLLAGVFSAALGLKGFLLPNGFIDGGVTGISLLTGQMSGLRVSALVVAINITFI